MFRKSMLMIITIVVFLSMAIGSYAQVEPLDILIPNLINYQGQLVQKDPMQPAKPPIAVTGTYTITFRIYGVEEGGVAVWEEEQQVDVKVGIFNTVLGKNVSLNIRFDDPDKNYWLAMQAEGDDEMSPRQRIASTAHSFMSQDSYSLNGFASGANNGLIADMVDNKHYSDIAKEIDDDVAAHANLKTTHGIAGEIVGTSDTQTLTNKSISGEQINSGKISNDRLNMGDGNGINADMVDGVHYTAISGAISNVNTKIDNHISADQVTNASGSYPSMSVGYASSSGITGSVNWSNISNRPSGLDDGDQVGGINNVIIVENIGCWRGGHHELTAQCPSGYKLLSCSGGPGDLLEAGEYWYNYPDVTNQRCIGVYGEPACFENGHSYQRVIAICARY